MHARRQHRADRCRMVLAQSRSSATVLQAPPPISSSQCSGPPAWRRTRAGSAPSAWPPAPGAGHRCWPGPAAPGLARSLLQGPGLPAVGMGQAEAEDTPGHRAQCRLPPVSEGLQLHRPPEPWPARRFTCTPGKSRKRWLVTIRPLLAPRGDGEPPGHRRTSRCRRGCRAPRHGSRLPIP